MEVLGNYGKSTPSLYEMANVCGIPGNMVINGQEVAPFWLEGRLSEIMAYKECEVMTTYLIWLRLAHIEGFFSSG